MAANETWYFTFVIGHVGNATADFKYNITFPTGATFTYSCGSARMTDVSTAATCPLQTSEVGGDIVEARGGSGAQLVLLGTVVNGGTAGNIQLQWAQGVATAVDTKVLTNSYLEAHK